MKYLLALFLLASTYTANVCIVTFVKGSVVNVKTKRPLRIGDKIMDTDQLLFTPGSSISYRVPQKGAFVMEAAKIKKDAKGQLLAVASAAEAANKYNLAGKKGGTFSTYEELKAYFAAGGEQKAPNKLLVIGEGRYQITDSQFEQNEQRFFAIIYMYEGKKALAKLASDGNWLLLNKDNYRVGGVPIDPALAAEQQLIYINRATGDGKAQQTYITNIDPVFVSKEEVVQQLNAIVAAMEGEAPSDILDACLDHLAGLYGMPDNTDVKQLLKDDLGIAVE